MGRSGGGMPVGWDMDYDGRRWFYTYKPTGQVQYHFPNEGDEFPDYIDAQAPVVPLAPEEKLESQQQKRRNTSDTMMTSGGLLSASAIPRTTNHYGVTRNGRDSVSSMGSTSTIGARMSAQARPVSNIWEGDGGHGGQGGQGGGGGGNGGAGYTGDDVFQPENFMYLGPGVYTDVSPLIEEEEEAARRAIAGDGTGPGSSGPGGVGVSRVTSKAASPAMSLKTTPTVSGSELSPPSVQATATLVPGVSTPSSSSSPPAQAPPSGPAPILVPPIEEVEEPSPEIYMLDGREMPQELPAGEFYPANPVGIMAEMPTEHTAMAQVETNPPAVEIGDNSILAPVEVAMAAGLAANDGSKIPVDQEDQEKPRQSVETAHEDDKKEEEPASMKIVVPAPTSSTAPELTPAPTPAPTPASKTVLATTPRASTEGRWSDESQYQAYTPGQASPSEQRDPQSQPSSAKRLSLLQRDPSFMAKGGSRGPAIDPADVPEALAPRKHAQSISQPSGGDGDGAKATEQRSGPDESRRASQGVADVPLALQPTKGDGKGGVLGDAVDAKVSPVGGEVASPSKPAAISKVPSVLKPARGRAPSQSSAPTAAPGTEATVVTMQPALKSYQLPPQDPGASELSGVGDAGGQAVVQKPVIYSVSYQQPRPPVQQPLVQAAPIQQPAVQQPPVHELSVQQSPTRQPPMQQQSIQQPPIQQQFVQHPPVQQPQLNQSFDTQPPVSQQLPPIQQAPVTQPLTTQYQQPVRPATAFSAQRRPSAPAMSTTSSSEAAPPLGLPAHVAPISRPASTPAVVAPLKLGRKPVAEAPMTPPGGGGIANTSFQQPVYTPPVQGPESSQMRSRTLPFSSTSGPVSPEQSRSSRSDSMPLQSPSPLGSPLKGHVPSQVSLTQSISNDTTFTPSPASTTPGSGGQPTRRGSSRLRNSISGPVPTPPTPNYGPPVPSKIPLEQESYFPPQKTTPSPGPTRPPKEPEVKPQASPPLGPGPDAPVSGYGLGRIDEGREDMSVSRSPSYAQASPVVLTRRHSTASSIQPPRPQTVSSTSSVEHMRSDSPETRVSTLSPVSDQSQVGPQTHMFPQGQPPPPGQFPPQGQPHLQGQFAPQAQPHLQAQFAPQGQFPPQGQMLPHGQYPPPGQRVMPGPMPPQGVDPRQAGFVTQFQPPNGQQSRTPVNHRQSWHPQSAPQMMQSPPAHQPPGQPYFELKDKEKEHKWTKWFKSPKGTTLSKAPPISPPLVSHPSQPGLSNPNLGQMPMGAFQGAPTPNGQYARVPSGPLSAPLPQAGPPYNGMPQGQWPPVNGPGAFNPPHGMQTQGPPFVQPMMGGPQLPGPYNQGQPGPGPRQQQHRQQQHQQRQQQQQQQQQQPQPMNRMPSMPILPVQGSSHAKHPSRSNYPVVNPGDALGSHPPGGPSYSEDAGKRANRASVAGPPNAAGYQPQGDKWARGPADYSGGGWGRDD